MSIMPAPDGLSRRRFAKIAAGGVLLYRQAAKGAVDPAVCLIFDTDIMGDVDDVGAVAVLHALANRGEAEILAMGVCAKHPFSPLCLDALNHYFRRPSVPIGVNKGEGYLRESKYAEAIATGWQRRLSSAGQAPEAAALYRRVLAAQPDASVVMVSVGQLSNLAALLETGPDETSALDGEQLVRSKVRAWVCMGGRFPEGVESNIRNHATAARQALARWPGRIIFSGWELGVEVLTGGRLRELPESSPVRRAYELYNGIQPHKSWDQTAVLYAVRYLDKPHLGPWKLGAAGVCEVDEKGGNTWRAAADGPHHYLLPREPPAEAARMIEDLMMEQPHGGDRQSRRNAFANQCKVV
jgi:inosine-uridine nucleoside N-ribohydrolase